RGIRQHIVDGLPNTGKIRIGEIIDKNESTGRETAFGFDDVIDRVLSRMTPVDAKDAHQTRPGKHIGWDQLQGVLLQDMDMGAFREMTVDIVFEFGSQMIALQSDTHARLINVEILIFENINRNGLFIAAEKLAKQNEEFAVKHADFGDRAGVTVLALYLGEHQKQVRSISAPTLNLFHRLEERRSLVPQF
ncbi:MAG: hypothetical protein JWN07_2896, partial [Hyphomicrobiales bacterium]|nr:hypothetical protein [Hyphomicrobiales bacterium]